MVFGDFIDKIFPIKTPYVYYLVISIIFCFVCFCLFIRKLLSSLVKYFISQDPSRIAPFIGHRRSSTVHPPGPSGVPVGVSPVRDQWSRGTTLLSLLSRGLVGEWRKGSGGVGL